MKLLTALCVTCVIAVAAHTEEGPQTKKKHQAKPPMAEQKAMQKELLEEYDTNRNGKIDNQDRAKISAEDKARMEKAGMGRKNNSAE